MCVCVCVRERLFYLAYCTLFVVHTLVFTFTVFFSSCFHLPFHLFRMVFAQPASLANVQLRACWAECGSVAVALVALVACAALCCVLCCKVTQGQTLIKHAQWLLHKVARLHWLLLLLLCSMAAAVVVTAYLLKRCYYKFSVSFFALSLICFAAYCICVVNCIGCTQR